MRLLIWNSCITWFNYCFIFKVYKPRLQLLLSETDMSFTHLGPKKSTFHNFVMYLKMEGGTASFQNVVF